MKWAKTLVMRGAAMTEEMVRTESAAPWSAPTSSGGTFSADSGRSYEGRE
jgi:hypothetical protein